MEYGKQRRHLLFQLTPLLFLMVAILVGTLNINTIRQLLIGALGENANIIVDTQRSLGPMTYPWKNLAQGGENNDWRLQPLSSQVQALGTEYVRLDHIYDFYDVVSRNPNGSLAFNFSKMDPIIKDITSAGARPYISLSYMPPAIAVNGDITAPPANWADWQLTVQRTVEHISGTLGISDVYYEAWNEPDLFGGYKTYGGKNYLDLYRASARGAMAARGVQPYKFGGPAITALYKNWVDGLMKMVTDENLPLDFFSWHRYSKDIEVYRSDVAKVREWMAPYPRGENVEMHITEWGPNSNNDPVYDNNFGAIHMIAVGTEMVGNLDKAFVFEIQDGKDPAGNVRWGRWGLIDTNNQAKPRYNAIRFLNRLGSERLQLLGRGSWVKGIAGRDGRDTTVILANYDPAGRHVETTPVTFTNIDPGNYTLTQQAFAGTTNTQKIATSSSALQINVPLSANTAVFLRLHPEQ
jgi:xylan 1,4-beta-xylosidase